MLKRKRAISKVIEVLTTENEYAGYVARKIKELPDSMRSHLFRIVGDLGEEEIMIFVENLKATYYNFTEEIRFLKNVAMEEGY